MHLNWYENIVLSVKSMFSEQFAKYINIGFKKITIYKIGNIIDS